MLCYGGGYMKFSSGEHIVVLGTTGSGKTFWCRHVLVPLWRRVIVVDTEDYDYRDYKGVSVQKAIELAASKDKEFKVRVIFTGDILTDEQDAELLFRGLLAKGHDVLLVLDGAVLGVVETCPDTV